MSSIYASRAMARSLGAFSAFAGGGRSIFGPFAFGESWSSDDFGTNAHFNQWVKPYLDQVGRKGMVYEAPTSATITRADKAWAVWKSAADDYGSPGAAAFMADIKSQMDGLISRADALSLSTKGWPFVASREESIEVQRYDVFEQIVGLIKKVANSATQASAALATAQAAGNVADPVASTISQQPATVRGDITSGPPGSSQSPVVASGSSNTLLYVGIGAAVLLAIGGVVIMRKRSSSVAGYRRRKRRSRR